jgi:hypothetical protein
MNDILERLERIEAALNTLVQLRTLKEWYSVEELAAILGKSSYTTREYCRRGRVKASKQNSGRGSYQAWVVSQKELERIQREGLLPER